MFTRILFCALCIGARIRCEESPPPSIRFRVQTFAQESAPITNPIAWVQLEDRVQEGSLVQQGDVVFRLNLEPTLEQIESLEARIAEARNRVERDAASMKKELQDLRDRKETLEDERAIQEAKLTFLQSLPRKEDLALARGRLAVAEKEMRAEEENLAKEKSRLERKLISPGQVEQAERSHALQQARTDHAVEMLRIANLPAKPEQIEVTRLRIENLQLEIEKLGGEIPNKEKILGIKQQRRKRQVKKLEEELAERQEELNFKELTAPEDGVLMYSTQFKRQLTTGSRPSKGMVIGEIPAPDSLALKGTIPEQTRHLFQVGDEAVVELNTLPGKTFRATLSNLSPFSQDVLEDEETSSGVKQVEVELEFIDPPEELKFGVYGWVTLISGLPWDTPRVPVSWVRYQSGKPHISVDGFYQPVDGLVQDDEFILAPPHPAVGSIQPAGEWLEETSPTEVDAGNLYTTSGELLPLERLEVNAPRVRAWDMKISWLAPDNTRVKEGEVVARLDSEMLTDGLQNHEERLETRIGEREATEQQLEITRSQGTFQLISSTNQLAIARLNQKLTHARKGEAKISQAGMTVKTARIQLEAALADLERAKRTPEFTARAELERRERDVIRKRLMLERAELNALVIGSGAGSLERSRADLEVARREADLATREARYQRDISGLERSLKRQVQREEKARKRLETAQLQIASLELKAPASGLLKYNKIYDGVRNSKVRPGMRIWPTTGVVSLSNTTEVYIEVPMPERYIHELELQMNVQVIIPSEGNRQWRGRITQIGHILEPVRLDVRPTSIYANQEATHEQVLPVRVLVDSTPGQPLKPGAVAQLIFPFER